MTIGDMTIKTTPIATTPIATTSIEDMINGAIQDYDKKRVFSDDMLLDLLSDNIAQIIEEDKQILKRRIKREKRAAINSFIKLIRNVYFVENKGLTVVIWKDGTRTEVKCQDGDEYNKEAGLAYCIIKYLFGNISEYNEIFKYVFENFDKPLESKKKKEPTVAKEKADFNEQSKEG